MAGRHVTDVTQKLVIILINHAAHQSVQMSMVAHVEQLPFLTDAAELVQNVNLVVIATLQTGVLFTQPVMEIAALMEQ